MENVGSNEFGPPRITPIRLLTQTQPQEGLWEALGQPLEGLEEVLGQPLDGKNVFFYEKTCFFMKKRDF